MPTFARSKEINRLLDSLENQTSLAFELIIVDQNENRLLEPILQRLSQSNIPYQYVTTNRKGLSIARNIAFPYAKHEIVGFPDDDCWYEDGNIAEIIDVFARHPNIDGLIGRWSEMDLNYDTEFSLDEKRSRRFKLGISGSSICIFMRKESVRKVNGFDERLGVPLWFNAGEETDFIMRCLNNGARIRYAPGVRIHHPVFSPLEGNLRDVLMRCRGRSRGTGALYRKHQLSLFVVFRGFFSPFLRCFIPPYSTKSILANFTTILGRIEGMFFWKSEKRG
jgi:glycosyltransferase involved in cell wall biosynthesis